MPVKVLGIFRESTNSPGREQDDALILKAVTEELTKDGDETHLVEPETIANINPEEWDIVMPMCENEPALKAIKKWKSPLLVNTVEAVLNCYRTNMTPLIQSCKDIHPHTVLLPVRDLLGKAPACYKKGIGVWVKRGDVHNTCDHDVVYVKDWEKDAPAVFEDFSSRGIKEVAVQEHIPGDLIKFYGVGPYEWFDWFYHKPEEAEKYQFSIEELEHNAGVIAKKVGLEIYGGDAIVTKEGQIFIIDINSWPSFARVRDVVKTHIARHIKKRALEHRAKKKEEAYKKCACEK